MRESSRARMFTTLDTKLDLDLGCRRRPLNRQVHGSPVLHDMVSALDLDFRRILGAWTRSFGVV